MIINEPANDMLLVFYWRSMKEKVLNYSVHHLFINSFAAFQITFCYFLILVVKKWLYFVSMPFLTYRFYDMRRGQRFLQVKVGTYNSNHNPW